MPCQPILGLRGESSRRPYILKMWVGGRRGLQEARGSRHSEAARLLPQREPQDLGSGPLLTGHGLFAAVIRQSAQHCKGHSLVTSCSSPWRH